MQGQSGALHYLSPFKSPLWALCLWERIWPLSLWLLPLRAGSWLESAFLGLHPPIHLTPTSLAAVSPIPWPQRPRVPCLIPHLFPDLTVLLALAEDHRHCNSYISSPDSLYSFPNTPWGSSPNLQHLHAPIPCPDTQSFWTPGLRFLASHTHCNSLSNLSQTPQGGLWSPLILISLLMCPSYSLTPKVSPCLFTPLLKAGSSRGYPSSFTAPQQTGLPR